MGAYVCPPEQQPGYGIYQTLLRRPPSRDDAAGPGRAASAPSTAAVTRATGPGEDEDTETKKAAFRRRNNDDAQLAKAPAAW
jgi:hypothetical protein